MTPAGEDPESVPSRASRVKDRVWSRFVSIDERVLAVLRTVGLPLLRISLGVVFLWFGALKVAKVSPVADLVARTVYWVDPDWFVPVLGAVEVTIGVGLLLGKLMRAVLLLFVVQMTGTFLVLVVQPEVTFQSGNPLLLTVEGEFVVKNLVLISAGLVLGASLRRPRRDTCSGTTSSGRSTSG